MHTRMLVTMPLSEVDTSREARQYVETWLVDEGFCGNGRFESGYADWFVIGGRWSGSLVSDDPDRPRSEYDELGAEDDALVLTQELYDKHLKENEERCLSEFYCDVEDEQCGPAMIGTRWVVVVDYHS
jgi:hypothetical protein